MNPAIQQATAAADISSATLPVGTRCLIDFDGQTIRGKIASPFQLYDVRGDGLRYGYCVTVPGLKGPHFVRAGKVRAIGSRRSHVRLMTRGGLRV